jgi:hypothetical protein
VWGRGWVFVDWIMDVLDGPVRSGEGDMPRRSRHAIVPDVCHLPFDEAHTALVLEGFKVKVIQLEKRPAPVMGTVVEQDPAGGRRHRRGQAVTVTVHHPRDLRTDLGIDPSSGTRSTRRHPTADR